MVQRVTTNGNEWQKVITSDNEWQQVVQWYNEWQRVAKDRITSKTGTVYFKKWMTAILSITKIDTLLQVMDDWY